MPIKNKVTAAPLKRRKLGLTAPQTTYLIQTIERMSLLIHRFKRSYRLNYPSIEVLNILIFEQTKTGLPMSINAIALKSDNGVWPNIKLRVELLISKGLIEVSYYNGKCKKYQPTYKLLQEYTAMGIDLISQTLSQTA